MNKQVKQQYLKDYLLKAASMQKEGFALNAMLAALKGGGAGLLARLKGLGSKSGLKNLGSNLREGFGEGFGDIDSILTGRSMNPSSASWAHNATRVMPGGAGFAAGLYGVGQLAKPRREVQAAYKVGYALKMAQQTR